mgnify:CR=1 FL=1
MPEQLAYSSRKKRRRTGFNLCRRKRQVPGVGQRSQRAKAGGCGEYSGGCEALAWGSKGQLVFSSGGGSAG